MPFGRGRGVLALTSFEPCPRPKIAIDAQKPVNVVKPMQFISSEDPVKLMAKYSYKENAKRPGGFNELTIKQGEVLTLRQKGHKPSKNPLWWEVENNQGAVGYVPASYCMIVEDKPTTLPWLDNKLLLEEHDKKKSTSVDHVVANQPKVKPYIATYGNNSSRTSQNSDQMARKYYCQVCDKNLNGPLPYKMHMSSRAHKEEVACRNDI